ncbi:hypothetical protein [Bacillus salacetis]|uniref:hypothetical protein n=1 Tax=Bacillus salacetis TaxID=2315464 RepID=UPI001443FD54|nr:hypothetical protein [Bacillus salacetis]
MNIDERHAIMESNRSLREGERMAEILQEPFSADRPFEEIIQGKRSLVVFVRHPG